LSRHAPLARDFIIHNRLMPSDVAVDELYALPLDRFVAARTALARTLSGADAKRVKGLAKPTVVPWALNQVYWHARPIYDTVLAAGAGVRRAQIAALEGRAADVRSASAAHRDAIGRAVGEAERLAGAAGAHPDADQLARMFEAVSVIEHPPEPHGRFTRVTAPAGFEALTGVTVKPASHVPEKAVPADGEVGEGPKAAVSAGKALRAERREAARQAAVQREQEAARSKAEATLRRAEQAEARAREAWQRSKASREAAEHALRTLEDRITKGV
jgi:hypothetical protein